MVNVEFEFQSVNTFLEKKFLLLLKSLDIGEFSFANLVGSHLKTLRLSFLLLTKRWILCI